MMTPKACSSPKAVYVTLVLLLTGCSGGAEPDEPGPTAVAEPTAVPDAAPSPAPSTPPPESTAAAPPPPVASAALAVEEHDVGGVEVALTQVRRASGDTLNVRWRYRNLTQEEKLLASELAGWHTKYLLADQTYLLDPINQKKYLVITDAERVPVTSTTGHDFGEVKLGPGTTINSWAKFPAPPEDVETISVHIPGVIPFEEIPISR